MNILIVDDDQIILDATLSILSQTTFPVPISLHSSHNGNSALRIALADEPDILITDIRMPGIDGIMLAQKILTFAPYCKLIFLTNYGDKEYLRAAIKLQARAYIDKPLIKDDFVRTIQEVVNETINEPTTLSAAQMASLVVSAQALLKQFWFHILRTPNADFNILKHQCTRLKMGDLLSSAFRCLYFRSKAEVSLPAIGSTKLIVERTNDLYLVVLYAKQISCLEDSVLINSFQPLALDNSIQQLAIGTIAPDIHALHASYDIAKQLSDQFFFENQRNYLFPKDLKTALVSLDATLLVPLANALDEINIKAALSELKALANTVEAATGTPLSEIRDFFCKVADLIFETSIEYYLNFHTQHSIDELHGKVWETTQWSDLLKEIEFWLKETLSMDYGDSRIVQITTAYIRRNFANCDLSLTLIGKFTGYSVPYLSNVFKKQTGNTINHYIFSTRMSAACRLLCNTEKSLNDIAHEVGYSNGKYFSKSFHKHMGIFPSEYRALSRQLQK